MSFISVRRFGADDGIQLQANTVHFNRLQLLHFELIPALGDNPRVYAEVACVSRRSYGGGHPGGPCHGSILIFDRKKVMLDSPKMRDTVMLRRPTVRGPQNSDCSRAFSKKKKKILFFFVGTHTVS